MKKQKQPQNTQKKNYEPPKAEFVPLKLEERLFGSVGMALFEDCGVNIGKFLIKFPIR